MLTEKGLLCFSYEPELFPGLIYRMIKPRIVLLIFVSGKVVLTGETGCILLTNKERVIVRVIPVMTCSEPSVLMVEMLSTFIVVLKVPR